ncbi:MAG: type secretion protein [Acidimicrobiaceae bacterium]|nr:type secretion protein [Acidimicrobiaceae bacterium]
MTLNLDGAAILAFLLALMRGTAFLIACPPFATKAIPAVAKITIAAGLALAAVGPLAHDPMPESTGALMIAVALQVLVGAAMGFVVQLFVGAVQSAGALIDQFSGLNLPPSIDPLGLEQLPVIGQLYEWLATVLLFTTGADAILAQGFVRSFSVVGTRLPPLVVQRLPTLLGSDLAGFFAAAAEVAAPLVAVLFVAQLLLALLAKAAPQTNVFSLGFVLQATIAFAALGLAVVALPSDVANLVGRGMSQIVGGG